MGKKSSSAPKMDPRVGIAMEKQAQVAERQQQWYEQEVYPWLQYQTQQQNKWSAQDRALAEQNTKFWQDYATAQTDRLNAMSDEFYNRWKEDYKPIEDSLIADAERYNSSAEAERQAGLAIADTQTAQSASRQAANMQMQQYGINPTAGAYQAANRQMDLMNTAARAAAANQARSAAEALGWQKKSQVASLGQGYIGNALNAANSATSVATGTGGLAQNSLNQQSAFGQLGTANISNLANVGLNSYQSLSNAWGQYGNLAMQASNYNMNAWQANQQASANATSGIVGAIGTVGTIAATAI